MKKFLRTGSFLALAALLTAGPAVAQSENDTSARESRQNGEINSSASGEEQAAKAAVEASLLGIYQPWVDYSDGKISVAFDQAPVMVAVSAFRDKTGFEIVLPAAAEHQLLNLHLTGLPLEPAVRSMIQSIGFRSFALMYDETGRPNRAVVVAPQSEDDFNAAATKSEKMDAAQPLTPEERESLQKQLEHWHELKEEVRGRIEDRLKSLPPSEEREQLVKEYGRQVLGIKN